MLTHQSVKSSTVNKNNNNRFVFYINVTVSHGSVTPSRHSHNWIQKDVQSSLTSLFTLVLFRLWQVTMSPLVVICLPERNSSWNWFEVELKKKKTLLNSGFHVVVMGIVGAWLQGRSGAMMSLIGTACYLITLHPERERDSFYVMLNSINTKFPLLEKTECFLNPRVAARK